MVMTRSTPVDRVIEYCPKFHDTFDSSRSCHYTVSFYGLIIQAYFSHLYLISCKIILESHLSIPSKRSHQIRVHSSAPNVSGLISNIPSAFYRLDQVSLTFFQHSS